MLPLLADYFKMGDGTIAIVGLVGQALSYVTVTFATSTLTVYLCKNIYTSRYTHYIIDVYIHNVMCIYVCMYKKEQEIEIIYYFDLLFLLCAQRP